MPAYYKFQVPLIPKKSAEDTTLKTINRQGETVIVPVPKDTPITINVPGLHYNRKYQTNSALSYYQNLLILSRVAKYWEDPETFKPDRFLKPDWNRDAFVPFSVGARACLGRKYDLVFPSYPCGVRTEIVVYRTLGSVR